MAILVTGATGTVGSEVVKTLSGMGINFKATSHTPSKADMLSLPGVEVVHFDFSSIESIKRALQGIDRLFLLLPGIPNQAEIVETILGEAGRVKQIVKLSVIHADTATSPIGRPHGESEKIIKNSGIPYTFLRPTSFMQNFLGFSDSIRETGTIEAPAGNGKVSFVDARDIASVAAATLTEGGHEEKIYNITGGKAIDFHEAAKTLSQVLRKNIEYRNIDEGEARQTWKKLGRPDWLVEGLAELYRSYREGKRENVFDTIEKVARKKPIPFKQFALDYSKHFLS